ncbi:MAG: DNA repair protein RecO [Paludibacteraceae bacterium]|nr:DNA repair protein RecO [Paludibacteraceae bacterium]
MLTKTKAIVLSSIKVKDNTLILHLYTEEFGRCNYLLFGAQSKRGGKKLAFIQPLSLVEIEAEHHPNKDLQKIKEIKVDCPTSGILFNPYKNSIAFFLSEILTNILKTSEKDETLFLFIHNSIRYLDTTESGISNFHITFLVKLSYFLGLWPDIDRMKDYPYFDLKQASFVLNKPFHNFYLETKRSPILQHITRINYRNMHVFRFSRNERNEIIEKMLDYYRLHMQGIGDLKSLSVLKEVFD